MKSNWPLVKLEEIAELTVGFVGTMAKHYTQDGVTFLRSTNIEPFNIKFDDIKFISSEFNEKISKSQLRGGDVVIVRTGKPGACTVIPEIEGSWNCSDLVIVRPHQEKLDPLYLAAYINLASGTINNQLVGAVQQHFNVASAKKLEIPIPPIEVQRKISSLIGNLNDKIAINNKINDNLEQQASVLVEQYFASISSIVPFSDIMSFENGFAFQSSTYLPSGQYRIITIKNVQDGQIDATGAACIDELPHRMKVGCILQIGDALLSLTGNVGRVGIVCEKDLLLNQRVAKIVPYRKELLPLLYFIYRHPSIKTQLESIAKGTAQLNLSPVETLKLSVPYDAKKALELSNTLSPIYQAIVANNQQSINLASMRDVLLPKLMSGEIDISNIDA